MATPSRQTVALSDVLSRLRSRDYQLLSAQQGAEMLEREFGSVFGAVCDATATQMTDQDPGYYD